MNEKQLGDLIWDQFDDLFRDETCDDFLRFREYTIGNHRPDFVGFSKNKLFGDSIDIYELKLFADAKAIRQILEYKAAVTFNLSFLNYRESIEPVTVRHNLICLDYSDDILGAAWATSTGLYMAHVAKNNSVAIENIGFSTANENEKFMKDVMRFFKDGTN